MKTFETEKHNIPEGATHYANEETDLCFAWFKDVDGVKHLWTPGLVESWQVMQHPADFYSVGVKPIPTEQPLDAIEKVEPQHGEWWMCDIGGVNVVFLNDEGEWRGDDKDSYTYNNVKPLYKMEKTSEAVEKVEWNGEGLPPVGVECEYFHKPRQLWVKFIPLLITNKDTSPNNIPAIYGEWYHPNDCMWEPDLIDLFDEPQFRKPETEEQRKEREELEAAYDLSILEVENPVSYDEWLKWEGLNHRHYLAIVRKTGYRKGE